MFEEGLDKTISTIEVPSGNLSAGIGYIIIPDNDAIDRDEFVEDCLRTKRVSIYGGLGYGTIHDVSIDESVLQRITFPKVKGERSTPIVWLNIPVFNKPVVIAALRYDNDFSSLEELERNFNLHHLNKHIDVSFRAKEASCDISIKGDAEVPAKLNLNVTNENKTSEVNVFVKGNTKIHSTESLILQSDKKIDLKIIDKENVEKCSIVYEDKVGLIYKDEFKNEIILNDSNIQIKSGKKKIVLQEGKEPIILGDTLKTTLEQILDGIAALTVGTVFGPSSTPINSAVFTGIKQKLDTILSKVSSTD